MKYKKLIKNLLLKRIKIEVNKTHQINTYFPAKLICNLCILANSLQKDKETNDKFDLSANNFSILILKFLLIE